jgi:hypothetical protein
MCAGYLAERLPVEAFLPVEPALTLPVWPEAPFGLVLPRSWAGFFAATEIPLKPLVVLPALKLLVVSFAILICVTFFHWTDSAAAHINYHTTKG